VFEEALIVGAAQTCVDGFLRRGQRVCRGRRWSRGRTEHAMCMRATEPRWPAWMRKGWGRRSRMRDWRVEGPRGAKHCVVGEYMEASEGSGEGDRPRPGLAVSTGGFWCGR
jgi:hypothetical protein